MVVRAAGVPLLYFHPWEVAANGLLLSLELYWPGGWNNVDKMLSTFSMQHPQFLCYIELLKLLNCTLKLSQDHFHLWIVIKLWFCRRTS